MQSVILNSILRTPFLGGLKLALAERNVVNNFSFYTTNDEKELREIYRIRYKVYCEEYHYLDSSNYPDHEEKDEYDQSALHLVVRHKSGDLAAISRLILGSPIGLPIQQHFQIDINIPAESMSTTAEISRLVVARTYRRRHLLLILIKGMYLLVRQKGINDVFCVLDDRLIPNLRDIGIPLHKAGPQSVYQGLTTPFLIHTNELEETMQERNIILYRFISNGVMKKIGKNYKYAPH